MDASTSSGGEDTWRSVGVELRRLRTERGLSLAGLSRQMHYSKGYLSKIETGDKRITPEVARIADDVLGTGGLLVGLLPGPAVSVEPADEPQPVVTGVCPYPGLVSFGLDEARWFFGREQVTAELIARLDEHLDGGGPLVIVAPSGAGKSSLLAAGLGPALARGALPGSRSWTVLRTTPGAHPLRELAARVADLAGADPGQAAAAGKDPQVFSAVCAAVVSGGKQDDTLSLARVVLIVDQFEETFTECQSETERYAFITALCAAARTPTVLVVLGMRADFYGRCLAYPALRTALQSPVALGPLSPAQLREVITGPAATESLDLEPGLVELLVRDLGAVEDSDADAAGYDPGALPLLAHALRATWQQRDSTMLTVAGYQRTGGIRQALATTAERTYHQFNPTEQQIARQLLLRLINVSDHHGTGDTRRRLSRTQLIATLPPSGVPDAINTVLEAFGRARLLTFGTTSVEITHEALLRAWPRLRQWIDADRAGNLIRQELEQAAAVWDQDRGDTAVLYRGSRLEAARAWATSRPNQDGLSPVAAAFLAKSSHQEHHSARLRRTVLILLATLALVASGAAAVALQQNDAAQRERDTAIYNQIIAQADRLRSTDVSLAAQLDLTAYRMQPTSGLYTALLTAENATLSAPLTGHTDPVNAVAFSPDGHTLATGSDDHTARLWNVTDPTHPTPLGPPLTGHTNAITSVVFSPDGHTLATGSVDQTVRLWNVADPTHPTSLGQPLTGHTDIVNAVAFSPDGRTLATGSADQTMRLWNVADPTHPTLLGQPLTAHTGWVTSVVFSPDGHTLATGSFDRTVRLWNVADPTHSIPLGPPLSGHTNWVTSVAFSPDGHTLATGSADETVRLWDVRDTAHPMPLGTPLTGHTNWVRSVAFSPDGHTLATGSHDRTARLWSIPPTLMVGHTDIVNSVVYSPNDRILATGSGDRTVRLWNVTDPTHPTSLGQPLTGHTNTVEAVAFSPDGHTLATGSDDQTVRLWNVTDPTHPTSLGQPLAGHTNTINLVAFSPDGRTLASCSGDRTVRLWNVTDPTHPTSLGQPLTGHTGWVFAVAFSPDGGTLATGSADQTVRLWKVTDPTHPTLLGPPLTGHTGWVTSVVFSPDGHTLATGSDDRTVRLWKVTDPTHPTLLGPPLTGHTNWVYAVAFSPDGHTLATGSADHTVRLWELNIDQAIQRICATTTNTLTPTKWEKYVSSNLPYHPPCP